jgi:hypothetical protein
MGCDIHLYVETREPATGAWRHSGAIFQSHRHSRVARVRRELLETLDISRSTG